MKNNSFVTTNPSNTEEDVLSFFPKVAYFNHSCAPTATIEQLVTAAGSLEAVVVAIEDVKAPGEEVTICYRPEIMALPRAQRLRVLKENWGFDCTCTRCQQAEDEAFLVQMPGFSQAQQQEVDLMYAKVEELFRGEWEDLETAHLIRSLSFSFLKILTTVHWKAVSVRKFLLEVLLTIEEYESREEEKEKARKQLRQIIEQLFRCNARILPHLSNTKMTLLKTYLQHGGTLEAAVKLDPNLERVNQIFGTLRDTQPKS